MTGDRGPAPAAADPDVGHQVGGAPVGAVHGASLPVARSDHGCLAIDADLELLEGKPIDDVPVSRDLEVLPAVGDLETGTPGGQGELRVQELFQKGQVTLLDGLSPGLLQLPQLRFERGRRNRFDFL